jgi:6-phosphofructokinase 1
MDRIGVLTSGGDAPGMNAAIRAVVRSAGCNDMSVIGFKRGYNGPLMREQDPRDDFEVLTSRHVSNIVHRGGTFLMTARCMDFHDRECQEAAIKNMRALGVEGLVVIGGDGTLSGANDLDKQGFPTMGIPGTIDNDLAYTDCTLGFDTALNTACECVNRIRETSDSHERASLITVMGRNCGDIALHTALACGAELVMVPEIPWEIEDIAARMKWGRLNGKRSTILILAEGAYGSLKSDPERICLEHEKLRPLGNAPIDAGKLAEILEVLSGQETRATVLGYIQRGGSPSAYDRTLAGRMGEAATRLLKNDISGRAIGMRDNRLTDVPLKDAIGLHRPDNSELFDLIGKLAR